MRFYNKSMLMNLMIGSLIVSNFGIHTQAGPKRVNESQEQDSSNKRPKSSINPPSCEPTNPCISFKSKAEMFNEGRYKDAFVHILTYLEQADASKATRVTRASTVALPDYRKLTKSLVIRPGQLADQVLFAYGLPSNKLENLDLSEIMITDYVLSIISERFPHIRNLNLTGNYTITGKGLASLVHLTNLENLNLESTDITDTELASLHHLTQLRKLNLSRNKRLTNGGLVHFAALTQLRELNLSSNPDITDEGLTHLAALTQLRKLVLNNHMNIRSEELDKLAPLKQLRVLHLKASPITNKGLAKLARLSQLRELGLSYSLFLTNKELKYLTPLSQLQVLDLRGTRITNGGLAKLAPLTELRELYLTSNFDITDKGLKHLARLAQLRKLHLSIGFGDGITDAGLARFLPSVKTFRYRDRWML